MSAFPAPGGGGGGGPGLDQTARNAAAAAQADVDALEGPDLYIIATSSAAPAAAEFLNVAAVKRSKELAMADDERVCVAYDDGIAGAAIVLVDGGRDRSAALAPGEITIAAGDVRRTVTNAYGRGRSRLVEVHIP